MIFEPNVFEITVREVLAWSSRCSIVNKRKPIALTFFENNNAVLKKCYWNDCKAGPIWAFSRIYLNPLMPGDNKKVTSMRDLFVINRH